MDTILRLIIMVFGILDLPYKKAIKLYEQAEYYFSEKRFLDALEVSNIALDNLLSQDKNSFLKRRYSYNIVCGNLYYIRSCCFEDIHGGDPAYIDVVIENSRKAIEYASKDSRGEMTQANALLNLAIMLVQKSALDSFSYIDEAYDALVDAENIFSNIVGFEDKNYLWTIKFNMARCLAFDIKGNKHYDMDKAILLMEEVLDYCQSSGEEKEIPDVLLELGGYYIDRSYSGSHHQNIDRGIFFLSKYVATLEDDDPVLGIVYAELGSAMLSRGDDSKSDAIVAYEILNKASALIDKTKHPDLWAKSILGLIKATVQRKDWLPHISDMHELKQRIDSLFDDLFLLSETGKLNAYFVYETLFMKVTVREVFNDYKRGDTLDQLIPFIRMIEDNEDYRSIYIDSQLDRIREMRDDATPLEIAAIYHEILAHIDDSQWPAHSADIYFGLGKTYYDLNNQEKSSIFFKKGIDFIVQYQSSKDRNAISSIRKNLKMSDRRMILAPSTILETDGIIAGISAMERIRLHSVTPALEQLYAIEKQANRHYWMEQYILTKQGEMFFGFEKNMPQETFGEQLNKLDANLREINSYKGFYKNIDDLIEKGNFSEHYFIENIRNYISQFDSWVLIPFSHPDSSQLLLIPPQSNVNGIIKSKPISVGLYDNMIRIIGDEFGSGWYGAVINYGSRKADIEGNNNLSLDEKNQRLDDLDVIRSENIDKMGDFLWEYFCEWIVSELDAHKAQEPVKLTIVAQAEFSLFPFCMAKDRNSHKYFLDYVDIAYVPSLFALYSLQERLAYFKYPAKMAFVEAELSDSSYAPIEQRLSAIPFWQEKGADFKSCGMDTDRMISLFKKSTYWHIASHGEVKWGYYADSAIARLYNDNNKVVRNGLPPKLFSVLQSETYLRLVILSTCQSGVSEVWGKELAPEGFLMEILKSGAIGAIGTLWTVPDISSALVFGRFYHHHIIEGKMPATALCEAQKWLRDIRFSALRDYLNNAITSNDAENTLKERMFQEIESECSSDDKPFEEPIFWASFVLVGQ